MHTLEGIPGSPGIAWGPAVLHRPAPAGDGPRPAGDPGGELRRLHRALARAREQLAALQRDTAAAAGQEAAGIIAAQQMFLDDPELLGGVEGHIHGGTSAEAAWTQEIERFAGLLAALDDAYFRERAADVRDAGRRVLLLLGGIDEGGSAGPDAPAIVVAPDLTPSETARLAGAAVLGLATARGGRTSHTAILARSLGLPAVVGLGEPALDLIRDGTPLILDGDDGVLVVDPDAPTIDRYRARRATGRAFRQSARLAAQAPAVTADGHRVHVAANIGDAASVESALAAGAEGVGLLRTEFLFLDRPAPPDEEEQFEAYHALARRLAPRRLVIRTLDVGGDKPPPWPGLDAEANPFLGLRAIRISLAYPDVFKTQLRAILRAAAGGHVQIILPMIATVDELRRARGLLAEARAELEERGAAFAPDVAVGIMIEVPAAALAVPSLAREAAFFSLGTNDLVQYVLAVDRTNERVAYLYDPLHPAVLHLVKKTIDDAHAAGRWVGMCGEMAGDPEAVPLLLGLGLDELSVSVGAVPEVKALIRSLDFRQAQALALRALSLATAAEIRALVRGQM